MRKDFKKDGRGKGKDRGKDGKGKREMKGERFFRPRTCRFCKDPEMKIDYKDGRALNPFVSDRGKIVPRRMTSVCASHQRLIATAVKRARILALLPFTSTHQK